MKRSWKSSEVKVVLAFVIATLCTFVISLHLGAPVDPGLAEDRIKAFYEASYRDGKLVSAVERDMVLLERGYDFSAPVEAPSFVGRAIAMINWYPTVFGVSLGVLLFLSRPRLRGAPVGLAGVLAVLLISGTKAGIASAAAIGAYFVVESIVSRRSRETEPISR